MLDLKFYFESVPADLSKCDKCKEPIFFDMRQAVVEIVQEKIFINVKLCEKCFFEINGERTNN